MNLAPASPVLTAVDPLAWGISADVLPARPFLYSVDANGITITRFNDNQIVGTWPWPETWVEKPNGTIMEIFKPVGGWGEPVGMTVSYPTEMELANRVKEMPDLTPPPTFVYVVMPHSGYQWASNPNAVLLQSPNVRDSLVPMTSRNRVGAAPADQRERPIVLNEPRLRRSGGSAYRGRHPRPQRGPAGLRPLNRKCLCRQHAVWFPPGGPHFVRVRDPSHSC